MTVSSPIRRDPAEWSDARPHAIGPIGWIWVIVVVAVPALVLAVVAGLLVGAVGAIVVVVVYAVGLWIWIGGQGRLALRSVRARPLSPGDAPRAANLLAGLAHDLGVEVPSLMTSEAVGPNALVCRKGGPVVMVSGPVIESFTRTEFEAVLAHCLLRSSRADLWRGALAAGLGALAGPAAPHIGPQNDAVAAAVTRYPPGLAAAIGKCEPMTGRFAPLWFCGTGPTHTPPERRVGALADL